MRKDDLQRKVEQKYVSVGEQTKPKNTKKKRVIIVSLAVLLIIAVATAYHFGVIPKFEDLFPGADPSKSKIVPYTDPCQCPDDRAKDNSLCGDRSAWSRGSNVVRYDKDGRILRR